MNEKNINICELFKVVFKSSDSSYQINYMLKIVGETYEADRCYIFEMDKNNKFSNTYEWCNKGVKSEKDNLQNESIDDWYEKFIKRENVIIEDIENIKNEKGNVYVILKPQGIKSLIAVPIFKDDLLFGFVGIDNPNMIDINAITKMLSISSNVFSNILQTRNLSEKLDYITYHDELTGLPNRKFLDRQLCNYRNLTTLGVIYLDIIELRNTNEKEGMGEGDKLICRCSELISKLFYKYDYYRVSGDEFLIILSNIKKGEFNNILYELKLLIRANKIPLLIGHDFEDVGEILIQKIMYNAEMKLYDVKYDYYSDLKSASQDFKNRGVGNFNISTYIGNENSELGRFLKNSHIELDTFFDSLSLYNGFYPFIGDLRSNTWYIFNPLKNLLGLESNVVECFESIIGEFVYDVNNEKIYPKYVCDLVKSGNKILDFRAKIRDKNGKEFWARIFNFVQWDRNKEMPLSFYGNIVEHNYAFEIDSVTNFFKEEAAADRLLRIVKNKDEATYICFKFNGFGDVNQSKGRHTTNSILSEIAQELRNLFSHMIKFFRLYGLRFLAIIPSKDKNEIEKIAKQIQSIVGKIYSDHMIVSVVPCSISVVDNTDDTMTADSIMNDIMNMFEVMKSNITSNIIYSSKTMKEHIKRKRMVMTLNQEASGNLENFRVVVQPIVSLNDLKIVGGELLLRWKYEGEEIPPNEFIAELEKSNLIIPVGKMVAGQAVKFCQRARTLKDEFYLHFNFSYNQIEDSEFYDFLKKELENKKLDGNSLVLEITEKHEDDNPEKLQRIVDECKKINMRIALDDFGAGYSTFEMFFKYPADIIKLDKNLVGKMTEKKEYQQLMVSVIDNSHSMNKKVCIEGVETQKELKLVIESGADMVQGYRFYKPMELEDFYNILATAEE